MLRGGRHPSQQPPRRSRRGLAGALLLTSALVAAPSLAAPPFRDLNHNGKLDPYENPRLSPARRTEDLLRRMTLEEKVGTMLHGVLPGIGSPIGLSVKGYDLDKAETLIVKDGVNSGLTRLAMPAADLAAENNKLQHLAEKTRLGIPLTISSDPRNQASAQAGQSTAAGSFTVWPSPLGFAALGSLERVRAFADIARREYRAVGVTMALSPQADLATEPRWGRIASTFGDDPAKVSALSEAYVAGFQNGAMGLRPNGVATIVKHWVGYGAEPEGFDAHNAYGRTVKLDNESFAHHLAAFDGPLRARTAGVMPTYAIVSGVTLDGHPLEPVGAGFNRQLTTTLLRDKKGFKGLVVSDFGITSDCPTSCRAATPTQPQTPMAIAMPWGVEDLSEIDRTAKAVNAGVDQLGGVNDPRSLLAAVKAGKIPMARVDQAVRRALLLKFQLGLFDNPFVDVEAAKTVTNDAKTRQLALETQEASLVVLENKGAILPEPGRKVWLRGVRAEAAERAGFVVVTDRTQADLAIIRVTAPSQLLHPAYFFGHILKEGSLDFAKDGADFHAIQAAAHDVKTIVIVDMDRPAILTDVRDLASGLIAAFGATDEAVMNVVAGKARAEGRLPLDLPSSMADVEAQDPARSDTPHPLYRAGFGLTLNPPPP